MSITDELREWANGNSLRAGMSLRTARDQVLAIADRIDAEHITEMDQTRHKAWDEGFDAGYGNAKDGYVRLPVDADGEIVRIGDEVRDTAYERRKGIVRTLEYKGGPTWTAWLEDCSYGINTAVLRHYHAPTVEEVLVGLIEKAVGYSEAHTTTAYSAVEETAKRLRMAESEDNNG